MLSFLITLFVLAGAPLRTQEPVQVVGQAVTEEGEPLASCALIASNPLVLTTDAFKAIQLATDHGGNFSFELPTGRRGLRIVLGMPDTAGFEELRNTTIIPPNGGFVDLGRLKMKRAPLLVDGTVIDDLGRPVVGAQVEVSRELPWCATGLGQFHCQSPQTSASDGRFEVRGWANGNRFGVLASSAEMFGRRSVRLGADATGVVLTLQRAGSVHGRLLLPESVSHEPVNLFFSLDPRAFDASMRPTLLMGMYTNRSKIREDGTFAWTGLEPGSGNVAIRVGDLLVLAATDVVVKPGEETHDPRLSIDLREQLQTLDLVVRGNTSSLAFVRSRSGRLAPWGMTRYAQDGVPVSFLTLGLARDVQVHAPGFLLEEVSLPAGEHEIALRPAITVTLALVPSFEPAPGSPQLSIGAELPGRTGPPFGGALAVAPKRLGASGNLKLTFPAEGQWHPVFQVTLRINRMWKTRTLELDASTQSFAITEASRGGRVELQVPQESIDAAVADMLR